MPTLGSAPRRVSPGVWRTRKGITLTPAQAKIWEGYYRDKKTDGRGHWLVPHLSGLEKASEFLQGRGTKAPGIGSVVGGAVAGAVDAFGEAVGLGALGREVTRTSLHRKPTRSLGPIPGSVAEPAALTGRTARRGTRTAADLIFGPDLTAVGLGGHPHSGLGLGLDVAGIFPFGRGVRLVRGGQEAVRAAEAARGAETASGDVVLPLAHLAEHGRTPADLRAGPALIEAVKNGSKPAALLSPDEFTLARRAGLRTREIYLPGDDFTYRLAAKTQSALDRLDRAVRISTIGDVETAQHATLIGRALGYSEADIAKYIRNVGLPDVPLVTPQEKVARALPSAKKTYAEQKALRSEELVKRVQSAGHAAELAGGGEAGIKAALGELKGKLPHLRWDALTDLTEPEVHELINSVDAAGLEFFDNLNAKIALWNAAKGEVLTPSEQKLIERVIGPEAAAQVAKGTPLTTQALRAGGEILNIPRSILSSFDVSGVLRQGLVASIHHPGVAAKNLGPMFKMLVNENYYQDIMRGIERRPNFDLYHDAGLSLTELGPLAQREEGFMSNLAEKIPLLGRLVRGSGRSYTGFLNLMRADIFDTFLEGAVAAGRPNTPQLRKQIARQVNAWTGRGSLGRYGERVAVPLNTVFFSPRLFSSRVQTFTTPFYKDLDPYVRKQAALAASKLVASGTAVLLLAAAAGGKVQLDPRSSDWGKIRIGNTRFDIWGGHQQIARLIAQVSTGTIISSTTGKTLHLGNQFGDLDRTSIVGRFVRGKFSPGTALIYDWFKGTDYQNKPFSWKKRVLQSSIPLLLQDIYDVQKDTGNPFLAVGAFVPGAFGIGVQNYKPKKQKEHDPFSSIYTGGGESNKDPFGNLFTGP